MIFCKLRIYFYVLSVLLFQLITSAKSSYLFNFDEFPEELSKKGVNGGLPCLVCTLILGIVEQLTVVYEIDISDSLVRYCDFIPPGLFRLSCEEAINIYGPVIINGLNFDLIAIILKLF